jgi:gamma-butyrobetaine dioxygenase
MSVPLTEVRDLSGRLARWPAIWLRDNCHCVDCRDPRNDQKLFGITDLPRDPSVVGVAADGGRAIVEFDPPHRGEYPLGWLAALEAGRDEGPSARRGDDRTEAGKRLWRAADLPGGPPSTRWADYLADPAERLRCLASVRELGFALLREVPVVEGTVVGVAGTFGYVRRTNYGELFEVRVEEKAVNLAFTSLPIRPHTDNPYRDPVPTIQLLHCLRNAAGGGDSGLVDGFHAAALLRSSAPEQFELLTRTPVVFRYSDAAADLTATRPLIGLDPVGRIREVRFNNRSLQPLGLPADELDAYYRAYRRFAQLLYRPEAQFALRLEPGDCLVFDNTRVLHARTGFTAGGARHLQGCYADLDGAASNLAVLRRAAALPEVAR